MKPKASRSRWKLIIGIVAAVLALCCLFIIAIAVINPGGIISTSTPTLTPTFTLVPTNTITPTSTVTPTPLPTDTPVPTDTPIPTFTVVVLPTLQQLPAAAACPCTGDTLNCTDFTLQAGAQSCMDYCIAQGAGDIHNLDGDANGVACESLP